MVPEAPLEKLEGMHNRKSGMFVICIYVWTYVRHFCTMTLAFLC